MSNDLRSDESVGEGLRRIVVAELDAALASLTGSPRSEQAIHDARRRIKKARAITRLVQGDVKVGAAPRHLRVAARLLAPIRDEEAIALKAEELCSREPHELSGATYRELRHVLKGRRRPRHIAERDQVVERAVRALRPVRQAVSGWHWNAIGADQLVIAIQRTYKQARSAWRQAKQHQDAERFHEWRKALTDLRYALRLVAPRAVALGSQVKALGRLEEWLGDDHDLLMLRRRVVASDAKARDRVRDRRVRVLVKVRQAHLRKKALEKGKTVFDARAKAFGKDLRRMWPAAPEGRQSP